MSKEAECKQVCFDLKITGHFPYGSKTKIEVEFVPQSRHFMPLGKDEGSILLYAQLLFQLFGRSIEDKEQGYS